MEEMHLAEFREFLKQSKGLGLITIDHYCRWMREFDLNQISQDYLNQYIQSKGNNSQVRGAVMSFLEMNGIELMFMLPKKTSGTKKKRVTRKVSVQEFEKVKKHLYSKSFRGGLVFDLIYHGALRRAEVSPIQFNSFQWSDWLKDITKPCKLNIIGKGNKERVVLIPTETMERMFNHFAKRMDMENEDVLQKFINSPSLLFKRDGKVLTNMQLWRIIHNGSKEAIGRDIRPHELRHARATYLTDIGVPVQDVKNYLGHSSIGTTEIYLHRDLDESIDNIQQKLEKTQ